MKSNQNEIDNKKIPDEEYISLGVKASDTKENHSDRKTSLTLSGQHKLNSDWVFWYISRKEKVHDIPYEDRLKKIAGFSTLEDFFKYYVYLKSASEVERNTDLSLFKEGHKPLWESCPDGGCWFFRFKKSDDPQAIDLRWEKLVFALIGEQFNEPNMLGAVLSIRGRETIIEIWFNYLKNLSIKALVAEKMRELLNFDQTVLLYFKDNEQSLQDRSTLKNAETYNLNAGTTGKRKSTYY